MKKLIKKHKPNCQCPFCKAKRGELAGIYNSAYKHGKCTKPNYCIDCGKEIDYRHKRCIKCSNKSEERNSKIRKSLTKEKIKINCGYCGEEILVIPSRLKNRENIFCNKSCNAKFRIKEKSARWKNGITPLRTMIRHLDEYDQWKIKVFKRDNYICQECFQKGGKLEAHHIKFFEKILAEFLNYYNQFSPIEDKETLVRLAITWSDFWDIDNGKTLCKDCHKIKPKKVEK